MTTKHTPGPWAWDASDETLWSLNGGQGKSVISPVNGCVYSEYSDDPPELDVPNRHDLPLIAAAPELLEEAESAARRLDWFLDMNPDHVDSTLNVIRQNLRAAIAKARGAQ